MGGGAINVTPGDLRSVALLNIDFENVSIYELDRIARQANWKDAQDIIDDVANIPAKIRDALFRIKNNRREKQKGT